jgi:hypothetical protein
LKILGEVWIGRPWTGANEVELTKVPKSGGRRRKKGGGTKKKKGPMLGWQATAGNQSGLYQTAASVFSNF